MRATILLLALAAPAAAQERTAPFVVAETGKGYATIDEAVTAIRDDDATILIAPGTYRQCTVQTGGKITFKARQPGTAIFEKEVCEEKAGFVLRGRGSTIDGVVFRGYAVSDGNGAGIRHEMGDLTITNSMFLDSQEGISGRRARDRPPDQHRSHDFRRARPVRDRELQPCDLSRGRRRRLGHPLALRARHRRPLRQVARAPRQHHRFELRRQCRQEDQLHDRPVRRRHRADRAQHLRPGQEQGQSFGADRGGGRREDLSRARAADRGQCRQHGPRRAAEPGVRRRPQRRYDRA